MPPPSPEDLLDVLHRLQNEGDLRHLYCSVLNYDCAYSPISTQNWPTAATELVDYGRLIARHADFSVIFFRIRKLSISDERRVLRHVLEQYPDCVVVFRGVKGNLWHIVYPRTSPLNPTNFLTRRFAVGPDERLRTASERLRLTYAGQHDSTAAIRRKHETAFDTETLSREFLKDFKRILDTLHNDLLREGKGYPHTGYAFVQQLLNRLTFLYFIEKTGWLNGNFRFIRDLLESYEKVKPGDVGLYERCIVPLLFSSFSPKQISALPGASTDSNDALKRIPFLSSKLFARNELDDSPFKVSDEHVQMIIDGLLERFNFTLEENLPFDAEVAIDPSVLGNICESMVVKEKRRESGAFYTPRIEVDFMCRQALTEYLIEKTGRSSNKIISLLWSGLGKEPTRTGRLDAIRDAVQNVRIVDPACGSGALLVGMMQVLVEIHESITTELGKPVDKFQLRSKIIQDNLFGVDVNPWALQATKWRLWLSLMAATPESGLDRCPNPLLPGLEFLLRVGDSVVQEIAGLQFNLRQMYGQLTPTAKAALEELVTLKRKYYHNAGKGLSEAIEKKKIDILAEVIKERLEKIVFILRNLRDKRQRLTVTATEPLQESLEYTEQRLEAEKQKLNRILRALRQKRPKFAWEIDFPEVFADGGFDIVIGNPPYVRHESIAPPDILSKAQTRGSREKYKSQLARSIEDCWNREPKPDMKSDLYIYFFYNGLSLLKPGGILCFITPNSWLDVEFGFNFQRFLLRNTEIKAVFNNLSKRTFAESDINAIVSIFKKPRSLDSVPCNTTRFVALRKPYEEILCSDSLTQMCSSRILENTNAWRCVPISQRELWKIGLAKKGNRQEDVAEDTFSGRYRGEKWGSTFLRAPDILYAILKKGSRKLVRIEEIGRVRYPIKTGINEFFYLDNETAQRFGVERDFLIPVVKSPKEFNSIRLEDKSLKTFLFQCTMNKEELSELGKTGALSYIEWGEQQATKGRQKTAPGVPWPQVPSVKGRKPGWYSIEIIKPADVICSRFFDKRFFFGFADSPVIEDQTFYGLTFKKSYEQLKETQIAILNSTLSYLLVEIFGRAGLGQGVLQYATYEMRRLLTLDAKKMAQPLRKRLDKAFGPLANRKVKPIFGEVKMKDRRELDDAIFDFIDLSEAEREGIYSALTQLVQARLEKATTFSKRLPSPTS